MKKQKSFTIIELLVVVSIIGLLASIVLVATKEAREKAAIARNLQFGNQIRHGLGAYAVGEWEFENNLNDTLGEDNHGDYFPSGGTPVYEDGVVGKALSFNGSNGLLIPDSNSIDPRNDLAITIDVWLKFNNLSNQMIVLREPHYYLYLWAGKLEFSLEGFGCSLILTVQDSIETGRWYHIIVTYIPKDSIKIYLNGKQVASKDVSHYTNCYRYDLDPSNPPGTVYTTPIEIGGCIDSCGSPTSFFNGLIEVVRIYNMPITLAEDIY